MPYRIQKPGKRPKFNRAHPLARGCVFATAMGWERGYGAGSLLGSVCDVGLVTPRGVWSAAPADASWNPYGYGMAVDEGAVAKRLAWTDATGACNVPNRLTMFAAFRKEGATLIADNILLAKRNGTTAAFPGYSMGCSAGGLFPGFSFEICDGGGVQASIDTTSTGVQYQFVDVDTTLCCTYDGTNMVIWVNGRNVISGASGGLVIGSNTNPVSMFNNAALTLAQFDGAVSVAAIWNRVLPPSAIAKLHSDPMTMWRDQADRFGFGSQFGPGGRRVGQDDCCPCEC